MLRLVVEMMTIPLCKKPNLYLFFFYSGILPVPVIYVAVIQLNMLI